MTDNKIIKETDHYKIEVGPNPYDNDQVQYLIINKDTAVLEADTRMLPMAKKYLMELEAYSTAVDDMDEEGYLDMSVADEDDNDLTEFYKEFKKLN